MRKFVSSSTSRYTTVLIGPPPLHWLCYHYMRGWVRKSGNGEMSENMTSPMPPPEEDTFQRKNAPLQNTAGRRNLCYFT